MKISLYIAVLCLLVAPSILIHQCFFTSGGFFDLKDFMHHENIAVILISFALGIISTEFFHLKNKS